MESIFCTVGTLRPLRIAGSNSYAAIGTVYISKGASFVKSQKFLGIGGFFSRLKDKGTLVKETWGTISTAIDAQMTMEEMAKMEEKGGDDWTDEKKAEYERKVTGKILAAAWRGSKFEIQSVLRFAMPEKSVFCSAADDLTEMSATESSTTKRCRCGSVSKEPTR